MDPYEYSIRSSDSLVPTWSKWATRRTALLVRVDRVIASLLKVAK
jgi:hypothetical protein